MALVTLSRRARNWADNQVDYLVEHNPQAAERLQERIATAIRLLEQFPRSGSPSRMTGVRRLVMVPYVLTYREAAPDRVIILDIRHDRQRESGLTRGYLTQRRPALPGLGNRAKTRPITHEASAWHARRSR